MVLRLWNCHWQDKADYGEKYDWGYYEISPVEMKRFWSYNVRVPTIGWLATDLKPYDGPRPDGRTVDISGRNRWWVSETIRLGGEGEHGKRVKLTRGVRLAAFAIEAHPRRVILVGFDNVRAGISLSIEEGYHPAYASCPAGTPFRDYTGGKPRYSSHDYTIEWPFLCHLAEIKGLKDLVFAEDYWQ